ncbi:hypothetical protein [Ekhidna sp.]|uniref:hypothetical protein n=1 Tax=Ekhidna sp. TaxID=2608089 RepID=UPI003BABBE8C
MRIKDHWQYSDEVFEETFESFRLKPGMFSHEAHLRLAYIHIKKYGARQAEQNMCNQIKGYAESLGVYDKFNKTVTIASVKAMNHFMQKSNADNFKGFIQEFPRLLTHFKEILGQHYGFNVFADQRAKREFVEPDLLPFQ